MRRSSKAHISLVGAVQNFKLAAIEACFAQARPYKIGKATFRAASPHHSVMPKVDLGTISYLKSVKIKFFPTFPDILLQPHPKGSCRLKRAPLLQKLPYLESTAILYQASLKPIVP
ncbi:hypothetical protein SLA2020_387760 [Shorea laevis]